MSHQMSALPQQTQDSNTQAAQLFADAAHVFRTQLDVIIGFSEVLQEQAFGALNVTQQEYVNYILTSGAHLLSLVNTLLELARMEAGARQARHQAFALRPLLEESLALVRGRALAHDITLSLEMADDIDTVVGAVSQVKQITFNLLSHALQEAPNGRRVGIKATRTPAGTVRIAVWYSAPTAAQKRMLEALQQDDSTLAIGTNMGLVLTKKLAILHGDTITGESRPRRGCRISFSLPLAHTPSDPPPPALQQGEPQQ